MLIPNSIGNMGGLLAGLLESGAVQVIIDKTYPFEHTAAAIAHMLGHHARGKIAITVS